MEATSAAQLELEKIEEQIAQLESAAGDNTEAQRQLKAWKSASATCGGR